MSCQGRIVWQSGEANQTADAESRTDASRRGRPWLPQLSEWQYEPLSASVDRQRLMDAMAYTYIGASRDRASLCRIENPPRSLEWLEPQSGSASSGSSDGSVIDLGRAACVVALNLENQVRMAAADFPVFHLAPRVYEYAFTVLSAHVAPHLKALVQSWQSQSMVVEQVARVFVQPAPILRQ